MVCGFARGLVPGLIASAILAGFLRLVCGFGCVRVCDCGRTVLRCGVLPQRAVSRGAVVGSRLFGAGLYTVGLRAVVLPAPPS